MGVRAAFDLGPQAAKVKTYYVAAGQSITEGRAVSLGSADEEITPTAAGAAPWGIALESKNALEKCQVLVGAGDGLVKVKVGTGGATRGSYAVVVADGLTNAPVLGAGTVLRNIVGQFAQTGVVGDVVGFRLNPFAAVSV
jgi:hypothetical protein